MFTLRVGKAETYDDIEQRETRIRVPFEIVDEDGSVATEIIDTFPIGTSKEEITETLQRHLTVYSEDHARYEAGKARQEQLNQSEGIISSISGLTI